jgi:molybdate transport system permease protein
VLPPTVLGFYLLVLIGRRSPIGRAWETLTGGPLVFTPTAAVIAAAVASAPFCLRAARAAFSDVDQRLEEAARVAGLSEPRVLVLVTLPLGTSGDPGRHRPVVRPGARRLRHDHHGGGQRAGTHADMPIAVYDRVQAFDYATATVLAVILSVVAVAALLLVSRLERTAV